MNGQNVVMKAVTVSLRINLVILLFYKIKFFLTFRVCIFGFYPSLDKTKKVKIKIRQKYLIPGTESNKKNNNNHLQSVINSAFYGNFR